MPTASPPHTKHCPRCEQSKPVADFGRNKATSDGLAGYCKGCAREYSREWRARNQPRLDTYEVRHANGKQCHRCGETKTADEFAKDATKGSGRKSICRPCDREKSRLYYIAKQGGYRKRSHEDARQEQEYLDALRLDPCAYCGGPGGVIDHIEPKAAGGEDGWENLTGACQTCNCSKNALPLLTFMGRTALDRELAPLLLKREAWVGGEMKDVSRWLDRRVF